MSRPGFRADSGIHRRQDPGERKWRRGLSAMSLPNQVGVLLVPSLRLGAHSLSLESAIMISYNYDDDKILRKVVHARSSP